LGWRKETQHSPQNFPKTQLCKIVASKHQCTLQVGDRTFPTLMLSLKVMDSMEILWTL
jgi:hypothetical protein